MTIELIDGKFHRVKVVQDSNPTSPREVDNLGTMVCWHSRYNLGDEQPSQSPYDFRRSLACEFDPYLESRLEAIEEKYSLGLGYSGRTSELYRDLNNDLSEAVNSVLATHIVELPLYLYDHSGITMSTSSFSCRWDSGQVGFIYVTKEKLRKEYRWKKITKRRKEKIYCYLKNEVKTYDDYLTGQVFGYKYETAEIPEDYAELALIDAKTAQDVLGKHLDLANELDWNEEDSCWGFYGDDLKTNGVMDYIPKNVQHLAEVVYD